MTAVLGSMAAAQPGFAPPWGGARVVQPLGPAGPTVGPAPQVPAPARLTAPPGVKVETVASGLQIPWALTFAPDGRILFTERPGRVRLIKNGTLQAANYVRLSPASTGEGGLMGIALHPSFPASPYVYLMYTALAGGQSFNRVSRFTDHGTFADSEKVIIDRIPAALYHDGGVLAFGPDKMLYVGTGDDQNPDTAQNLNSLAGKILRVTPDGAVPADNPLAGSRVYAYGLRNVQGLAWDPATGDLWATMHGPTGELGLQALDSIFRIKAGGNHGWPRSLGLTGMPGVTPPVMMFTGTSVPPAGAMFYTGSLFPELKGNFFFSSLGAQHLQRVVLDGSGQITRVERWFEKAAKSGVYGRLRAATQGPDGAIYLTTSNRDNRGAPQTGDDKILRLVPTGGTPGTPRLPDLVPQKPTDLQIGAQGELRFSTGIGNIGVGPIELQGPGNTSQNHDPQPAKQNVYGNGNTIVDSFPVGQFVWHAAHGHWHFSPELANYQLRMPDAQGSWQNGKTVGTGKKATFCFLDTRRVSPPVTGSPSMSHYNVCGTGIQGISVGWMDIYTWNLDGQSIDLTGVADGDYWLVYVLDPQKALRESNTDNNFAAQKIRLGHSGARRTVTAL